LRFDTGYELYYKQDDDFCFQARLDQQLEVWVFPVGGVHAGSRSLIINQYDVADHHGWDAFDKVKQKNQRYFAKKWAWALRGRRLDREAELKHLDEISKTRVPDA